MSLRAYVWYFRVSDIAAPVLVSLIIGSQAWMILGDIIPWEPYPDTEYFVMPYVFDCVHGTDGPFEPSRNLLKWWVHCISYDITGNVNFIPVLFSIGLMPLVYLLGSTITQDRIAGIISLVAFTFNPIYVQWSSVGTYDNIWSFFLLLSILVLYRSRQWQFSYLSYIVSILSKTMAIAYLPAYIAFVWDAKGTPRRKMLFTVLCIGSLVLAAGILYYQQSQYDPIGFTINYQPENLVPSIIRNISLFWQVLPLTLGAFGVYVLFKPGSAKRIPGVMPVVFFIVWSFVLTVPIHVFTDQLTFTYRYVPFAAFLSIFISMVTIRFGNWFVETRLK